MTTDQKPASAVVTSAMRDIARGFLQGVRAGFIFAGSSRCFLPPKVSFLRSGNGGRRDDQAGFEEPSCYRRQLS